MWTLPLKNNATLGKLLNLFESQFPLSIMMILIHCRFLWESIEKKIYLENIAENLVYGTKQMSVSHFSKYLHSQPKLTDLWHCMRCINKILLIRAIKLYDSTIIHYLKALFYGAALWHSIFKYLDILKASC